MVSRRAVFGDALRMLGVRSTPSGRRTMLHRSQLPFVLLLTFSLALILSTDASSAVPAVFVPWATVLVVTCVLYLTPWEGQPELTGLLTSILDLAAIIVILSAIGGRYPELALLQLLPVVVMAYAFGLSGIIAAVLATFAVAVVPVSVRADAPLSPAEYVRLIIPPLVIAVIALGVYGGELILARAQKRLRTAVVEADNQSAIMRTVLDTLDVGTAFVRPDASIAYTNPPFRELVRRADVDPSTLAGSRVYGADRVTPIGPDDQMMAQAQRGEYFESRMYWVGDPGAQRSILVTARPVVRADGVELGSAFVSKDVTELTDAIRAREEFLAGVSHELRTPLTSIIGYLEVVEDSIDVDGLGVRKELDIVQRNANQLMMRIGDLLHVADETVTMRMRPTDVPRIVQQAVDAIRIRAQNAGIEVFASLCAPFQATIDENRFAQVLDNLLTNAVKYTPRGGHVRVALDREPDRFVLAVADDGTGISEAEQERVFERFYRTYSVRGGAIGGAGLGLSIVRQIVQGHGGEVAVSSEPGRGSVFTVALPLAPAADRA